SGVVNANALHQELRQSNECRCGHEQQSCTRNVMSWNKALALPKRAVRIQERKKDCFKEFANLIVGVSAKFAEHPRAESFGTLPNRPYNETLWSWLRSKN